jgi:hypothetical protein
MKKLFFLFAIVFFDCQGQNFQYIISTYEVSEVKEKIMPHQENLKEMDDVNVFSIIHSKLIPALDKKHKDFFISKPNYKLLSFTKGDLFQNNKNDYAFIVYDTKDERILIVVYNENSNKYDVLFKDIKIENRLNAALCNYSTFGTLDYQIGAEIIYQKDFLIKNAEDYLESKICKVADITKDKDFILEYGCFSDTTFKSNPINSLCISTSSVYNNWECMKYDKERNIFIIFYGQAFAD